MLKFLLIITSLLAADLLWWREANRRLVRIARSGPARLLLWLFMAGQIAYLLWLLLGVAVEDLSDWKPIELPIAAFIWHVLLLPAGCAIFLAAAGLRQWKRRPARRVGLASSQLNPDERSRRKFLSAAVVAVPPLVSVLATRKGVAQMGQFRIRRLDLSIPQLPSDLAGLTIAHVSDLHVGNFMPLELTPPMADATNELECDLIAFTGDLIDASERHVERGVEFMRRLRPRHGMVMIEGNHDVVRNAGRFEQAVKDAGLPLLLDESMTFRLPGRATPVQFLGTTWGELKSGRELHRHGKERDYWFREYSNGARDESVRRVAAMREPGAFPILLAHHPHAFDAAAAAGLPLVLSGHTHGGQIMLTHNIGVGPLRFRYWSGLYRKPGSQMFISNGIGSWFPLRVNAPSEIVRVTLRLA